MSHKACVLDTDLPRVLHTYLATAQVHHNQFVVDAFAEVGHGNYIFGGSRIVATCQTGFRDSETADNEPFEKWEQNGSVDAATRANKLWKKRLRDYEAPALDAGIDESLRDFVSRRKPSMDDMWY